MRSRSELLEERIKVALKPIRKIIGVFSGKGGVGKTAISINIAAALSLEGCRVGILDADVDCPNVFLALGIEQPLRIEGNTLIPAEKDGIKVISMAGIQDQKTTAILWRGPLVTSALYKMIGSTAWGELDYLVIDMPPGTSDAPLTIMQTVKPHLIVIVTMPTPIAQTDAHKSINMAMTMGVPCALLENMTGELFGESRGRGLADQVGIPYLGALPLDKRIREAMDKGRSAVTAYPEYAKQFHDITKNIKELLQ